MIATETEYFTVNTIELAAFISSRGIPFIGRGPEGFLFPVERAVEVRLLILEYEAHGTVSAKSFIEQIRVLEKLTRKG
jgi:hypothetical protein